MTISVRGRSDGERDDCVGAGVVAGMVVGVRVVVLVDGSVFAGVEVGVGAVTWNVTTPIYPFASLKWTS